MPKNNKKKTYQKPTQEQIQYLRDKSKVRNTEKSTLNWIQKFQKYRSDVELEGVAEEVDNANELEVQLCEYFTVAEKGDGSPYSVSSLLAAIRAINRFYTRLLAKSADKISIPAENADIIADLKNIFRKGQLMLILKHLQKKTGINCEERKITNQAGRKTLVQRLKDIDTTDYEVSTITRHRSLSGIARYERPKNDVQQFALNNLITSIDSSETIPNFLFPPIHFLLPTCTKDLNLQDKFFKATNLVSIMPSTLPKQRSQVPASRLTNLSALPSPKILESTLQLTDPPTLSIPEALAPTIQIASHPTLSSPETLKQKPLVNSNLRRPLQP
ncbi:11379_t:CDS:2, partial [Gigaspora margarita]